MSEVRDLRQEDKEVILKKCEFIGLKEVDALIVLLGHECISYGRANPLLGQGKDTREMLKSFVQFIGENEHIRCVNDEAIDEFLKQEPK